MSKVSSKQSQKESEHREAEDYDNTSKVESKRDTRRGSILDINPHYKKSVINSIIKPAEQNEMQRCASAHSNQSPVILASND